MYPYRGDVNYINYVHEFRGTPQYDYIQKNGDPYMFELPDVQHFVSNVPFFLHTLLMWTEAVQAVNHMSTKGSLSFENLHVSTLHNKTGHYSEIQQGCGLLQQYES